MSGEGQIYTRASCGFGGGVRPQQIVAPGRSRAGLVWGPGHGTDSQGLPLERPYSFPAVAAQVSRVPDRRVVFGSRRYAVPAAVPDLADSRSPVVGTTQGLSPSR